MDLIALKTFLEVAKTHHFGRAADNLCVSQSTVSARIKTLEDSFGVELFIRERSNIHLSPGGEALVTHAKSILTLWSRARHEVGMPHGANEILVVGGLSGLWDISLQQWLSDIAKRYPHLLIKADIHGAKTLVERIMNTSMDVAFLYDAPQGLNLVSQPLKTIKLVMVSSTQVKNTEEALRSGFISVDWGLNFSAQFAARFPETPPAKLQTGLGRIAFQYLKQNPGTAYLAEPVVKEAITGGTLYAVPGAEIFERKAWAIYHQENELSDLIQTVIARL